MSTDEGKKVASKPVGVQGKGKVIGYEGRRVKADSDTGRQLGLKKDTYIKDFPIYADVGTGDYTTESHGTKSKPVETHDPADITSSTPGKGPETPVPGSYRAAYEKAGGHDSLGHYETWEKKAKDWNIKKYGTSEPTARARKLNISKSELSKVKQESDKPVQSRGIASITSTSPAANIPEKIDGPDITKRDARKIKMPSTDAGMQKMQSIVSNALNPQHDLISGPKANIASTTTTSAPSTKKQERRSKRVERLKGKIEKTKAGTANKARLAQLSSALSSAQERSDKTA